MSIDNNRVIFYKSVSIKSVGVSFDYFPFSSERLILRIGLFTHVLSILVWKGKR